MPELVDWQECSPADVTALAARTLTQGGLVMLPTESGPEIAASALHAGAVAALQKIAEPAEPVAVVITATAEAADWLPFLGEPGQRLVRKLGQGPWKLIADGGADVGLLQRLSEPVRKLLCPERHLALRWPDHPVWNMTARLVKQPMLSAPCIELDDDRAVSVIDSALQPSGVPTTLIRVTGKQWQVARAGGLSDESLDEVLPCRVLFVCTGNTCRSPMAEALMKRLLADRLGCRPEELRPRGFLVQSAGLAAMIGGEAAPDAVGAMRAFDADLAGHQSRRLTLEQLMLADHVFAMTESHLWALESVDVPGLPTPRLLSPDGDDVPDPIGAEPEVYRACAHEILGHLQKRLPEIL
jgi:L-threonylcarbamoyladenylate synthase